MLKKWRWLFIVLVVVALAGAGYYFIRVRRVQAQAKTTYETVTVRRGNLVVVVNGAGSIAARRQVSLIFGASGRVAEVLVTAGDVVKAGQPLLRLDTTDLEVAVAKAKLSLATAENQLKKLQEGISEADIASAQAAVKNAEQNLAKVKAGASPSEIAAATSALAAAEERLKKLRAGPDPDAIRDAEFKLMQSKNSLWASQNSRDLACSRPGREGCDSANASVANAEIAVRQAEIALEKAKQPPTAADVQDANAKYEQAKEALRKLKESPTPVDIAAAEAQLAAAKAKLESIMRGTSQEDLAIAKAQVDQANLNLKQAQQQLDRAILRAPFDGIVLTLKTDVGQWVGENTVVGTFADLSALEIVVGLSELDVVRTEKGQQATIQLDALPDVRLRGHVERVAPAAEITQGVANYPTTVVVDDLNPRVRPGMSANVSIIADSRSNVLLVPNRSLRTRGRERVVAIVKNGALEWVPVLIGASSDTMTEIREGLTEGQQIVSNPPNPTQRTGTGGMPGGGPGFIMGPGPGR